MPLRTRRSHFSRVRRFGEYDRVQECGLIRWARAVSQMEEHAVTRMTDPQEGERGAQVTGTVAESSNRARSSTAASCAQRVAGDDGVAHARDLRHLGDVVDATMVGAGGDGESNG